MTQLEFDEVPAMSPKNHGPCAWCEEPSEGNYWISCDGIGVGPLRPLCNDHGGKVPSAKAIRAKLRAERERGRAA